MNIRNLHSKIGCNYAWELNTFYKLRDFKDGITFFELILEWNKFMGDHNPQFTFYFMLLNFRIWEFTIYNVWHIDNVNSPYYQQYLKEEEEECLLEKLSERDGPNYEADNYEGITPMPTSNVIKVICRSRRNFYEGRPIYWYEFVAQKEVDFTEFIPKKFLNVPSTVFYEYGGSHQEAIADLTKSGFTDIVEGNEL
jgi:hypothetical protein